MILGSMLQDILEAEKKAKKLSQQAEKYRADAAAEVERKRKQMIEDKLAEAKDKVAALREEHKKAVAESMRSVEEENLRTIAFLRSLEKEKADEWAKAIFERVVSDEQ